MIKKGILLTLCVLVAGMARADEDWLVRRLKACENGSSDWACRNFKKTEIKEEQKIETTEIVDEIAEDKKEGGIENKSEEPKIEAIMKKPEDAKKLQAGDAIVNEFEEIAEKDWIVRRINACSDDKDDWACRHYERALQGAKEEKMRVYKEQLEEQRRQEMEEIRRSQEEEQRRLAILEELDRKREETRLKELLRQKKEAEEAERQRIQRENEIRKKAEEIIKRRVEEAKTYKKFSSGEERQQEDRILAEYYQIKLKYKSEGLEEKINWLEQSKKDL